MARWVDTEEGKRSVALSVSNAVFSKLIKLGRQHGKTPQRMAQELFEEAYAARCAGKALPAGEAEDAQEDFRQVAAIAEEWKAKHAIIAAEAQTRAEQVKRMELTIGSKDKHILDQAAEMREMRAELEQAVTAGDKERKLRGLAEAEVARLREAAKGQLVVVNQASEILRREEPAPPRRSRHPAALGLARTIRTMAALGNSCSEIAAELGIELAAVKEALG